MTSMPFIQGLALAQNARAKIISSGVYLPDQVVKSDDLFEEFHSELNYGWKSDWMSRFIGIKERRMSPDSWRPSDLAIPAALEAIEQSRINPDHIDSIYFCGIERDQPEPATAHVIQNALGLQANTAIDISNACFGFIEGMELASKDIRLGEARYVLVVTGEAPTKIMKGVLSQLKDGVSLERARQIVGALTVGDAGGAVIMGPADYDEQSGFEFFRKTSDSQHFEKCLYRLDSNGMPVGQMEMGPINQAVMDHHQSMVQESLDAFECKELDWTLLHQVGARQFQRMVDLKGINAEKVIKTFDMLGNITTATFPVNFNLLDKSDTVSLGDRIGGLFAGSGLVIGHLGYIY